MLVRPTSSTRHLGRRAVVLVVGAAATVLTTTVLTAQPALADVPENWSDPDPVSALHALLLLAGVPILLFVLISLAVYVPALARGERLAPGAAAIDDEWFGGPRQGAAELTARPADEKATGGASGSW